jgi:hypothetical protein
MKTFFMFGKYTPEAIRYRKDFLNVNPINYTLFHINVPE